MKVSPPLWPHSGVNLKHIYMRHIVEIEFNDDDIRNVTIDFEVSYDDGSFSFDFGSISGVHNPHNGPEITGASWVKEWYTASENAIIEQWISDNTERLTAILAQNADL